MNRKEIYAALELCDDEIRLTVGEFFESRFQVLRVEKVPTTGIIKKKIVDRDKVITAIKIAKQRTEESLGYEIARVLLSVPSVNMERYHKTFVVPVEEGSKRVRVPHIQAGLKEAYNFRPSRGLELVNISCIKYVTNGITSRRMPIGEVCDELIMKIDLLYADKQTIYEYLACVEEAGLDILDIYLDAYAFAQEAVVMNQTMDKYIVQVLLEESSTTLSLFSQGRLVSSELLELGYSDWFENVEETYGLSKNIAFRLAQNGITWDNSVSDRVIYVWPDEDEQRLITERQFYESLAKPVEQWITLINETSAPILEAGKVEFVLGGTGMELQSLDQVLDRLNAPYRIYVPETIGARNSSMSTSLGLFYSWKELQEIRKDSLTSCDDEEVKDSLKLNGRVDAENEGSFTRRFKNMLLGENRE